MGDTNKDVHNLDVPGYGDLAGVLREAYRQAAVGKGAERHAGEGEAFADQVMQEGAKRFGVGALLFQAYKKSEESQRLPLDRGVNELLGAIVYLAGAVIARRRAEAAKAPEQPAETAADRHFAVQDQVNADRAVCSDPNGWVEHSSELWHVPPANARVAARYANGDILLDKAGKLGWSTYGPHKIIAWKFAPLVGSAN
jgi:hypothetical protein